MKVQKCKNTVFCGIFLISVLGGTISGVLLFYLLANTYSGWISDYALHILEMKYLSGSDLLFQLCPLFLVLVGICFPRLSRWFIIVIFFRCLVISYSVAFYLYAGVSFEAVFIRCVLILPALFIACRFLYNGQQRITFTT